MHQAAWVAAAYTVGLSIGTSLNTWFCHVIITKHLHIKMYYSIINYFYFSYVAIKNYIFLITHGGSYVIYGFISR